jgi:UDP-N-acetylmuramyl pentapeptide phosphotransferase/UDP-N-acetylglucosamine-1-phosphate transferase
MEYLILTFFLFAGLLIYFRIDYHYNIIDKPNERSSHTTVTLRGGGVVYWLAAVLFLVFNHQNTDWLFFAGLTLIALISFYNDLKGTTPAVRLLFHLAAMTIVFYMAGVLTQYPWWALALGYIIFVGIINAWNFMDGINGITGLYSLAVLACLQYINLVQIPFVNPALIWYPMIASAVFLFFNFRKKARCFAGDVGSVTIAFRIVTLMLMLMIESHSLIWIGFMLVYGVDSVLTILHRLYLRQNIFKAHRLHFYQIHGQRTENTTQGGIVYLLCGSTAGFVCHNFPISKSGVVDIYFPFCSTGSCLYVEIQINENRLCNC